MLGAGAVTVKLTPLLATPPTVTPTLPVVAPVGTGATMLVAPQLVGVAATPLKLIVLVPCVAPKLATALVTEAPTTREVGFKLVRLGAGVETVKVTPLLATPPTVTTTLPVLAPLGTGATMLVALQLVGVAATPLNFTVLVPCVAQKFAPLMVMEVPTRPEVGFKVLMLGPGVVVTVKLTALLATPPTVTTTLPVVAPVGTGATMLVALQLVGVAATPLNLIELVPCVAPKLAPAIVTDVPTTPDVGFKLVRLGAGVITVKLTPLLPTPPTVTTTLPVVAPVGTGATMLVALQLVGVAATPLNLIVLVPCVAPKLAPAIVTDVPTTPDVGFKLVKLGAGVVTVKVTPLLAPASVRELPTTPEVVFKLVRLGAGVKTVKVTPLLATPPTVTTTLPVLAPLGTGATMLVALQLVGAAATPLNFTVLVPCVTPKFAPLMVMEVPTRPEVGLKVLMLGPGVVVTVKLTALLATPPTVTTTLPVVAPVGTGAMMFVALQLVGVAVTPLNLMVLAPWVAPKFAPEIVTDVPTTPDVGFKLVMLGAGVVTVKLTPLLVRPPTCTTTLPVVAPLGTGATMLVALQLVGTAATPLN